MPLDPNYGRRAQTSKVEGWRDAQATRQLVVFLLVVLVAVALWPVAVAFDWLTSVHGLPDPLGFTSFVMYLRPILAGAAALSCPIVLFLVVISHPQRASETLVKAALAVGVAVLAILLLSPLINGFILDWWPRSQPWWASEPVVPAAEIIARENAAVVSAIVPLVGIAVAFAVIAALSRSAPSPSREVDDATAAADRIFGSPLSSEEKRLRDAPPQPPSAAAKAFTELTYRVRPRPQLLLGLRTFFDDYEIRGISHEHFAYAMGSGLLKRESDGAVILSLTRRADALTDRFDVVDSETGSRVGSFRSRPTGWDIDDSLGRPVLFVIRDVEEAYRVRYIGSVVGGEVCRYTWSCGPFGLFFNVAVEVEFASGGPPFDRALAVALGPFIEEEARLLSAEQRVGAGD